MVRVKRPARSKTSQGVNKVNDPSICLSGVNSEVEPHGKGSPHASTHNMNHDLEERCSENCLSTSDDCPILEMDKGIATDQHSKPCAGETNIPTSNPNSTAVNNGVEGMKLNYHRRSECRREGPVISIEPSETYYSRRKGFLRLVKPLKTYHRRRSGYVTLRINPLPIQNSMKTKVEDIDLGDPAKEHNLCVVNNMCKEEMTAGESSNMGRNMVLERDLKGESHVDHVAAESENLSNPVLPKSTCVKFTEENSDVTTQEQGIELDQSEKSDMIVACDVLVAGMNQNKSTSYIKNDASSLIISDAEHVKRKHCDVAEASLSETMKRQRMIQPGTTDVKLLSGGASSSSIKRKLLVLDINGLLADIVPLARVSPEYVPDPETIVAGKAVFKRPFCNEFLEFCFERFDVGVWSSRTKKNGDSVLDLLMGKVRKNLLFFWDQSHCTCTSYYTPDNGDKPLFFKKLNKLWEKSESSRPWMRGDYDESNTLLLDDSPYKALLNPPNTAIFPYSYQYSNANDNSLGPGGDLRTYLEGLSLAPNVQEYVKQNSYGQDPITEKHESWSFYQKVIESTVVRSVRKPYQSLVASEKLRKDISQGNNTSVIAETSKESLNSNGTSGQLQNGIPILLEASHYDRQLTETAKADGNSSGSPSSIQRGYKRGRGSSRSKSPRNETSRGQSHSLSPKKCRRSKSPEPSHGSGFGCDNTRSYQNQTLRPKCLNFSQGKCFRGASCRLVHHQSGHQSYPDRRAQEHVGQICERKSVPRECYDFIQGKCKYGASCRYLHSVPEKANLGTEENVTHGKQWDNIRRDKTVPRECYDFIQGRCKWGTRCRFLHNVPGKVDVGTEANETHDKQRDKSTHRVCNDFIQGKCNRGESCRYLHNVPDKVDVGTEANETHDKPRDESARRLCNDFIQGKCNRGESCRYLHNLPDKVDVGTEANETHDKPRDESARIVCNDFIRGKCNRGESCRYLHSVPDRVDVGTEANETHDKPRDESARRVCNDFIQGKSNRGESCRYLHNVPDRVDVGTEANETHDKPRDESARRVCNDFIQGKSNRGESCRYLHNVPDRVDVGTEANETHDKPRDESARRVCNDFIQGKSNRGESCRYLHNVPDRVDVGTEANETHDKPRDESARRVCNDFIQGKCNRGESCRYLHNLPDKVDVGTEANETHDKPRDESAHRVCNDFIQGKCNRGESCRYLHNVPDKVDAGTEAAGTEANETHDKQRDKSARRVCDDFIQGKCNWGERCRFLHSVPDKADFGKEANETHSKELYNIRRENAEPRHCNDFNRGKCNWGASCRFLHSVPDKTDQRENAEPRQCNDFNRGKCNWGASCRFLHSVPDKTDQRENAEPRQCNDFNRGKCNWGASCRFLHSVPDKTDQLSSSHSRRYQDAPSSKISDDCVEAKKSSFNGDGRYKALPEICRNYTQGRCYKESHCRYLHQKISETVGLGSTSQLGDTSRYKAVRGVCRNYTEGICHKGSNCLYLHQEPDRTGLGSTSQRGETIGFKSLPEICWNYTQARCHKGSDCRFLHREPGMGVGSGSTSQLGETSRFKAVPEVCRKNTQGRCHNGSNCRYLHQELGPSWSAQFGETSRYKSLPGVCRNHIHGRCHKGSDCRYMHQKPGVTVGSGSTSQFDETSSGKAPQDVCRNYTLGRCHKGSECQFMHQEQGSSRSPSPPERCYDYTRGKCFRGVHCRYVHLEPDQIGSTKFYRSHQQDKDVSSNSKSSGGDEKGDALETLPSEPISKESFQDASTVADDDAKGKNHLENGIHLSVANLGDSDGIILDADSSVNEEKRGTMEALPNHPISNDSYEKPSVVIKDGIKDDRVSIVCAASMDNLGESDRMIQDSDNPPEQMSDL